MGIERKPLDGTYFQAWSEAACRERGSQGVQREGWRRYGCRPEYLVRECFAPIWEPHGMVVAVVVGVSLYNVWCTRKEKLAFGCQPCQDWKQEIAQVKITRVCKPVIASFAQFPSHSVPKQRSQMLKEGIWAAPPAGSWARARPELGKGDKLYMGLRSLFFFFF